MSEQARLFDDEAMKQFIVDGYCVVKTGFPAGFHEEIYRKTLEAVEKEGNPGNNLLPRVPQIQQIYDDPAVTGALTSILGSDYIMHSHRHPHVNPPESKGGGWHKDSYWGYRKMRDHHPRWVMGMYYPQDVAVENGPTGVIPGTQYFETRPEDEDRVGIPMTGGAGSVIIIHFDLWHRAFPNLTGNNRFMMKFQFTRMSEPSGPHWRKAHDNLPLNGESHSPKAPLWSNVWDWLSGSPGAALSAEDEDRKRLATVLLGDDEAARLHAAYSLSQSGAEGVQSLMGGLRHDNDEVKRDAAYGLGSAGKIAMDGLVGALDHDNKMVRGCAAYALGDMGPIADSAVTDLSRRVDDSSEWVRRNVSEALGNIASEDETAIGALTRFMDDEDGQVRFNTAYSLAKFGDRAEDAVPVLEKALTDENRYVRGHSAAALEQIGTPAAIDVLLKLIHTTRWCPVTTRESTF